MLPREYTRVEWIESTGSQYIDTGVIGRAGIEAEVEFSFTSNPTGAINILGSFQGSTRIFLPHYSGKFYLGYGTAMASNISATVGTKYNVITSVRAGSQSMYINGILAYSGTTSAAYVTELNMYLFSLNRDGASMYPAKIMLSKCKIAYNSTPARDYIPFIDASNIANLWDDINLTPATKSGTFLYGPAVIPSAPENLAHSISDGTVALTWTAADDYANHYKIVRDGIELADIDGDVFAYIDTTAEAGAAHTYKVVACNGTQDGGASSVTVQLPLLIPQILAALITPNPATINQKITITVTVSEIEKILEPTYFYSGEIYAGEV